MPSSTPDWSQCPAAEINNVDLPSVWSDTSILQCGFIYPSTEPMDEFKDCCLNAPAVQNDCFQYCETDNSGIFEGCVSMNIHVNGTLQVSCNTQSAAVNAGSLTKGHQSNWKARLAVLALAGTALL